MTDHHLDELASAYLDGAATPDEVARVEADPALQQRVDALAQVREALRHPVPVDEAAREAALGAALAAFEDDGAGARSPLLTSPAARWRWSPRTVTVVGAAAVALLLAATVPLLSRVGDDDDTQAARFEATSGALDPAESGGAATEDGVPSTTAAPAAGTGDGAEAFRADLGPFDTVEDLLAALGTATETTAPVTQQSLPDAGCPPAPVGDGTVAAAQVAGEPVVVVVTAPDVDGTRVATVYRERDCRVVERAPLP